MDNSKLPINQIIERIIEAASNNKELHLTSDEVSVLAKDLGMVRRVPVYSMDQVGALIDAVIIKAQPIVNKKD